MHLIITSLHHAPTLLHPLSSYIHSIHTHTHLYTHTLIHIHTYTLMYPSVSYYIQALLYTLPHLRIPLIYSPIHPWCLLPLTTCPRVSVPRASLRDSPDQGTLTCHSSSANTRIQLIPSPKDRPISPLQIRSLQLLPTPLRSRVIDPQSRSVHRLSPTNT